MEFELVSTLNLVTLSLFLAYAVRELIVARRQAPSKG